MPSHYTRKILVKTMKKYIEFEYKSSETLGLLTFPKEFKHNKIKDIKKSGEGFVCIHKGNGNTYDHYWGETELNALNNLCKYLLEKGWMNKN